MAEHMPQPVTTSPIQSSEAASVPWYFRKWFVVLALIFFFPVGLVLLWRSPTTKLSGRIVWTAVFAVVVVGRLAGGGNNIQPAPAPAPQNAASSGTSNDPAPAPKPVTAEDLAKTSFGDSLIKVVVTDGAATGKPLVTVEYRAKDNLTHNMIRGGIELDMVSFYTKLSESHVPWGSATVVAEFELKDKYGATSFGRVYQTTLLASEAAKVREWSADILRNVWQTDFVHPDLRS